jgi:hypothetical protein
MADPERKHGEPADGLVLTPEQRRRRRSRNIAIGLLLAALVVLFYVMTWFRFGGGTP